MLLSASIVNVVNLVLLFAAVPAVITWITPICLESKGIQLEVDDGEGLAMRLCRARRWAQMGADGRPRPKTQSQERASHRRAPVAARNRRGRPCGRNREHDATPLAAVAGIPGRVFAGPPRCCPSSQRAHPAERWGRRGGGGG